MDFDDDSSGTDDDFPPPRQNRMSRGGRFSGKGRPAAMASLPHPRLYEENDMEVKIHQLEREAYISVLRAFKAQADAISWDKEDIITGLRKELRLSNEEHIELLKRANEDETIRRIREWRKSAGLQTGVHSATQAGLDPVPSPSVSASRKKQDDVLLFQLNHVVVLGFRKAERTSEVVINLEDKMNTVIDMASDIATMTRRQCGPATSEVVMNLEKVANDIATMTRRQIFTSKQVHVGSSDTFVGPECGAAKQLLQDKSSFSESLSR